MFKKESEKLAARRVALAEAMLKAWDASFEGSEYEKEFDRELIDGQWSYRLKSTASVA